MSWSHLVKQCNERIESNSEKNKSSENKTDSASKALAKTN